MKSCGKTSSMSTSQAREINNNKKLTILRLWSVSRKECWTIVYSVGTGPRISIIYKWIHYNNNNNNNNFNNNNKIYLVPFPSSPMALYNQKRNGKVNLTCLWWTAMWIHDLRISHEALLKTYEPLARARSIAQKNKIT